MNFKKIVIRAFKEAGLNLDLWYDHSARQWVFIGPDTINMNQTGTCVFCLTDLTSFQWVSLAREHINNDL